MATSNEFPKVSFRELKEIIKLNLETGEFQPVMLLGPPGCGKTQICEEEIRRILAEHHGIDIEDVGKVIEKPAIRRADEMAGVAMPSEAGAAEAAMGIPEGAWMTEFTLGPILVKIAKTGKEVGVLILDEMAQAGQMEQKLLADVLDARTHEIGGYALPRNWIVVATGNRSEDKAGAFKILAHLLDRVQPYNLEIPVGDWVADFCVPHNVNPVMVECATAYADDGFFADSVPAGQAVYNTRRSTVRAAKIMDAFMASERFTGHVPAWLQKMLAAVIGDTAAHTVVEWVARRDEVPTGPEIIASPDTAKVPDQTGFQMIAANLAFAEVRDVRSANAALRYIMRLRTDLRISLGVKLMTIASNAGWLATDPAAQEFILKYQEYLPLANAELNK